MFKVPSKAKGAKSPRMMSVHIKPANKGKLHADLGVPEDEPISEAKLEAAKPGAEAAEKKRIQFAENAKKWRH